MSTDVSIPTSGKATLSVTLNGSSAVSIRIQGLIRSSSGELAPFARNVTSPSDRVPVSTNIATNVDGDVVACTIENLSALKRGQVYAIVQVSVYDVRTVLCAGYVYDGFFLALGTFVEPGPGGGEGFLRSITLAATEQTTAAGQAIVTVPTNALWRPKTVEVLWTATATVGTRTPRLQFDDGTTRLWGWIVVSPTANQTARIWGGRQTADFAAQAGNRGASADVQAAEGFPPIDLPEGGRLFIDDTADIDITAPADTATLVNMQVEEWLVL